MYNFSPVSDKVKHTGAHILAAAITKMRPSAKLGIGPVTKEGFYYDIDLTKPITENDFPRIEKEIDKIIKSNIPMQQMILDREEAMTMLLQRGQIYKAELIRSIQDQEISFYKTGEGFIDLCRGPHTQSTGEVGAVKITKIEDTHWNEDPTRPKMQRIYGIVFNNRNELNEYYKAKVEEEERDYRVLIEKISLGKVFNETVALNSRGTTVINSIKQLTYKHLLPQRFKEVYINYAEDADEASERLDFAFNFKSRSHKEYPIVLKSEISTNDILFKETYARHDQIFIKKFLINTEELNNTPEIDKIIDIFKALRIELKANVYTPDPDDGFINVVSNILQKEGVSHNKILLKNNSRVKIVFKGVDIFNREWKIGETIFTNGISLGEVQNILMIEHRVNPFAIFAYLLEHNKGEIPTIISPTKVLIIPIDKKFMDYSNKVQEFMQRNNIIAEVDFRSISLKRKIYLAEKNKSTIQLVVGEKEENTNSVSVRHRNIDQGLIALDDAVEIINNLVRI